MILGDSRFELKTSNIFSRITSAAFRTAVTVAKDGCTSPFCFQGTEPEMLYLLQEKLNFTFKVIRERATGAELENGSWYGKIGASR